MSVKDYFALIGFILLPVICGASLGSYARGDGIPSGSFMLTMILTTYVAALAGLVVGTVIAGLIKALTPNNGEE